MAKLRKWTAYRTIERPYTRYSKVRKKAFVKSRPGKKIIKFDMGDLKNGDKQFPLTLKLVSKDAAQIRTNAIEAGRVSALKLLEKSFGRGGFYFRIKAVPHHSIRENALAAGAGADRLSTGMKHSFGKIIGTAAQVEIGKEIMTVSGPLNSDSVMRTALKRASQKLPIRTTIVAETRKEDKVEE